MGMMTNYIVQSYTKGKGKYVADAPFVAKDVGHARRVAETFAQSKPMVIAFMSAGDAETGDYTEPKLIYAHGEELPEEVNDMERV